MIPGVNMRKSKHSEHQHSWGLWKRGGRCSETRSRDFRGPLLGSKEHLDWLKVDLHAAKIITAQDYKRTKD